MCVLAVSANATTVNPEDNVFALTCDADDCDAVTACGANGECVDGIADFSCNCSAGFVGDYCDTGITNCHGDMHL